MEKIILTIGFILLNFVSIGANYLIFLDSYQDNFKYLYLTIICMGLIFAVEIVFSISLIKQLFWLKEKDKMSYFDQDSTDDYEYYQCGCGGSTRLKEITSFQEIAKDRKFIYILQNTNTVLGANIGVYDSVEKITDAIKNKTFRPFTVKKEFGLEIWDLNKMIVSVHTVRIVNGEVEYL